MIYKIKKQIIIELIFGKKIFQLVMLYHLGYDRVALDIINFISQSDLILPQIVAITIQRLKRHMQASKNYGQIFATMPPQLYRRIDSTVSICLF